ncbi:MAG: hypothetical protein KH296_11950, partial [Ruminococcus sp.]|nr:hypothetical protein [Ruminococcus sp.]
RFISGKNFTGRWGEFTMTTHISGFISSILLDNIAILDSYNNFICLKFMPVQRKVSTNFLMEIHVEA